jgi:hypothetical protein
MNKHDGLHPKAVEFISGLSGPIVTTQWILTEVADAFCEPRDRPLFVKLLELIAADNRIEVVSASDTSFQRGTNLFTRRPDKSWSLTDCISFDVMESAGITEALTGDRHFVQAGYSPLFASPV